MMRLVLLHQAIATLLTSAMALAWTASEGAAPELLTNTDEYVVDSRSDEVHRHGRRLSHIRPYPGYQTGSHPIPYPWLTNGITENAEPPNFEQLPHTRYHPRYGTSLYIAAFPHAPDERLKEEVPPRSDPRPLSWAELSVPPGGYLLPPPWLYKEPVTEPPPQGVSQEPIPPSRRLSGSSSSSPPRGGHYLPSLTPGSVLLATTFSPDLEEMPSLTPARKPTAATPSPQGQIGTSQAPTSNTNAAVPPHEKEVSPAPEMNHFVQAMRISHVTTLPQSHIVPTLAPNTADSSRGLISLVSNQAITRYQVKASQTTGWLDHHQAVESVEPSVHFQDGAKFSLSPSLNETLQARSTATAALNVTPNAVVDLLSEVKPSLRPGEGLNLTGAFGDQPGRPSGPNDHRSSPDVASLQYQVTVAVLPTDEVTLANTSKSPALIKPRIARVQRRTDITAPHKKSTGFPSLHETLIFFSIFIAL